MAGFVPGPGLTYFLSIDGVAGNVTDPSHPGALTVSKYDLTVSRPSDTAGETPAAPVFSPLAVTVTDDAGLADLLTLLSQGKPVSGATLTARATGAAPYDAYKLDLGEVVVTRVADQQGGCPCRKSDPAILVMKSTEDRPRDN